MFPGMDYRRPNKAQRFASKMADQSGLTITKDLGLGCNSQPRSANHFLITIPSFEFAWVEKFK